MCHRRRAAATTPALPANTRFFAADPNPGAAQQAKALRHAGKKPLRLGSLRWPRCRQHVWFTEGTASEVGAYATEIVDAANDDGSVPVLVAYDVPGRDCGWYSAGGAATGAKYRDWIGASIVTALGQTTAVVIIEPDVPVAAAVRLRLCPT